MVGAIAVGVIGTITGPEREVLYVTTTGGLPAVIVGLMILARAPGPRLLAGLALGLEGILAGLFVPAGLAFAVVLPLIGLALVQTATSGRLLLPVSWRLACCRSSASVPQCSSARPASSSRSLWRS